MDKKKIFLTAVSSLAFIGVLLCSFIIFSNKKDPSGEQMIESVTYDPDPAPIDPDTPHMFTQSTADDRTGSYGGSNTTDESVTLDSVIDESTTLVPSEDTSEDSTLPSHSFTPGTP